MPMDDANDDFRSVLASVDRRGRRRWVYAHIVTGFWRRRRLLVAYLVTAFVIALPHLRIAGLPMLRIDIEHSRYTVLGQVFWPQDLSYLLLFVLIAIIGTLLAVALAGRVLCGWVCPHNAMLECLFRPIEAMLEGPAHRRMRQDQGGLHPGLMMRKMAKWALYVLLCLILATSIAALFTGSDAVMKGLYIDAADHPSGAVFASILTALMLFNFAWFREQTCTIVCPYGRLQAAMLDRHSLVPAYDARRGEPRGKAAAKGLAGSGATALGDCVDCKLCVAVCPTAIDIRNGSQLECIGCSACIDACDGVMSKLSRLPGLIAYRSENQLNGQPRQVVRPRTVLYGAVLALLIATAAIRIANRSELQVMRLRVGAMPTFADDSAGHRVVRQDLALSLSNRSGTEQRISFALPADLNASMHLAEPVMVLAPDQRIEVDPIVDIPQDRLSGGDRATILSITSSTGAHVELPITLRAP
jgi:cytochrome c oxidase accessory protein FixG